LPRSPAPWPTASATNRSCWPGLALQAAGLGWIAAIAKQGMSYGWLAPALAVAGIGISLCFPTVANAVVGSVAPAEMGIASGTNSSLREIGGVFGIAILASVFAHPGDYSSAHTFIDHFKNAVWLGAGFSALGLLAAAALPGRRQQTSAPPVAVVTLPALGPELSSVNSASNR
jgi:hypothetical protein